MGRIQSSIGLITGVAIEDTVNKLIALQARPRDLLANRLKDLQARQTSVAELTAVTLSVQLAVRRLKDASGYQAKTAASSQPSLLTASAGAGAAAGTYQFTPVRQAQAQHALSSGLAEREAGLGGGEFSFRFGGFVNESVRLEELNGGQGIVRGKIRVTDRSGASAVVDLRFAQTVDDVLTAINNADGIAVTAVAEGDRFRLLDDTGETLSNLRVQEVAGGTTAASLGLAGVNVAADQALGQDVLRLFSGLSLSRLNDGNGLSLRTGLPDLEVSLRDGSTLEVDFHRVASAAQQASGVTTAANGVHAQLEFTATATGADYDGVAISFIDTGAATQGTETVAYDAQNKTLVFDIDAGQTTADDVIAALANDPVASQLFTAARASGGDGTGLIDLADSAATSGGAAVTARTERTLADLLETINAADPSRLKAELNAAGDRLVLTDLSTDNGGTFGVTSPLGGSAAEDLGLTGTASGDTLTGGRLLGGLKTSLLRSLAGGTGLGALGSLALTDRSGAAASVDLSAAETLDDVIAAVNAAGLGIRADYNAARNGLALTDVTGAAASNLIVANGDGTNSADKLGLTVNAAVTSASSGALRKQVVSEQTLLASYNGGRGVVRNSFTITDSAGQTSAISLSQLNPQTIGDVIDAINGLSIGVEASLNDAGDGVALRDTAGGGGTLTVAEVGSGTSAADLHILGTATAIEVGGQPASGIDGSTTYRVTLTADESLEDLVDKINDLAAGVTASVFTDSGGSLRHHLSLLSGTAGSAGQLLIDGAGLGLSFQDLASAQDALLLVGSQNGSGTLLSSSSNTFAEVVSGLNVTVSGASTDPVTVTVSGSSSAVVSNAKLFVSQYNNLRDKLASLTFFNGTDNTQGLLFGSSEALRLDADLGRLVTGRFFGLGDHQTLANVGITIDDQGHLNLDEAKLQERFTADPEAVQSFFATEDRGFVDRADDVLESLVGRDRSLLVNRSAALQRQADVYVERLQGMNETLERSRNRLLNEFYNMESVIGRLQANLSVIGSLSSIQPIQPRSS